MWEPSLVLGEILIVVRCLPSTLQKKFQMLYGQLTHLFFFKIPKIILVGKGPTCEGPQMSLPLFTQTTTFTHNELAPTGTMKNG
jgi:hypothetical protein